MKRIPDPTGCNDYEAVCGGTAIRAFIEATKGAVDIDDSLTDLLHALMHWADRNNYDFDGSLDMAKYFYKTFTTEDQ